MSADIDKLLTVVPELFLYIIPGYIAFSLKEKYRWEVKAESFDKVLYSLVYSFIVQIFYSTIVHWLPLLCPAASARLADPAAKQAVYLVLSVILGLILVKAPKSKTGGLFRRIFNKNLRDYPNVWLKAMENKNGAWATVYLNNGIAYTGKLMNYTADPNDEVKEILLFSYRLSICAYKAGVAPDKFYSVILDKTGDPGARVLLKRSDILSIEISD